MTRQEALTKGYLSVKDLDDEELRAGKCRNPSGIIPRTSGKTETIPKDLYDDFVAEHQARWEQNLRERLDVMTEVIASVALDDTVEPRDRVEAAKYIIERVAGKPTERMNVTVQRAPWEELVSGIATGLTREQSRAQRGLTIDEQGNELPGPEDGDVGAGMVVDEVDDAERDSAEPSYTSDEAAPVWQDVYGPGLEHGQRPDVDQIPEPGLPNVDESELVVDVTQVDETPLYVPANPAYQSAPPAPSHDNLANSSSTMVADMFEAQRDLAERRKLAKDRIQAAKKARKIARIKGADAFQGKEFTADESEIEQNGEGTVRFPLA